MSDTTPIERIPLPADLLQAVVDYLSERPYRETAGLISGILKAAQDHRTETATQQG